MCTPFLRLLTPCADKPTWKTTLCLPIINKFLFFSFFRFTKSWHKHLDFCVHTFWPLPILIVSITGNLIRPSLTFIIWFGEDAYVCGVCMFGYIYICAYISIFSIYSRGVWTISRLVIFGCISSLVNERLRSLRMDLCM